jgi:radical SAM superfamily enzyme YgiQ (UPF0313 family)
MTPAMNVLFVYTVPYAPPPPAKPLPDWTEMSLGISYLASTLERAGHTIRLVVLKREDWKTDLDQVLFEFRPRLLCFTAVATEYVFVEKVARHLRGELPDVHQIIGGPHVSLQPKHVLEGSFDSLCIGEGECALVELADAVASDREPAGIANLFIKRGSSVARNPTRPMLQDIENVPYPHREMWRPWVSSDARHTVLLGRGCPYNCTYCCNHALRELAEGKYVRLRGTADVVAEIRSLCADYPAISEIYLEVESITANPKYALELAQSLEELNASRSTPLSFGTNVRILRKKRLRDMFEGFARAGFSHINVGLESGSEKVRREVLKRNYSNEELLQAFDDARSAGLRINAYNLIGVPGETPADFRQTIEVNRRACPDESRLSIFYPYPGTDLHQICVDRGLRIQLGEENAERYRAPLGLPEFPNRQVERYFRWFDFMVYRGKRPLSTLLRSYLSKRLAAHPRLLRWYRSHTNHGALLLVKRALKRVVSRPSKEGVAVQRS